MLRSSLKDWLYLRAMLIECLFANKIFTYREIYQYFL